MALTDLVPAPVTVATLAADGLLPAEIAVALGMTEWQVLAELGEAWANPSHVARVEAALFSRALGGVTWREQPDKLGGVIRLESERLPDVAAAAKVLAAYQPARYGQDATPPIRVTVNMLGALPDPVSVLEDVTPR